MSASVKNGGRIKGKRRPGDPWISKNRVLNGGTGHKAKRNCPVYRNPNFDNDETKLLIQIWGDPKVQRELITTHKKHVVISQLAAKMEEYGYYRSPEEITTRIKNMKCFYNRLKKEMESCKGLDPSWRHYAEMDAIMTRPIFSVRPNEVPAPSLKYLLEQEQEKRKERKRIAEEEGDTISESDEDIDDILAVPSAASNKTSIKSNDSECTEPDAEIEFELDEGTLAALEKEAKNTEKSNKNESSPNKNDYMSEAELAIKMELESDEFQDYADNEMNNKISRPTNKRKSLDSNKTINISEDEDLLVPKVEPIDVDEEYENKEKEKTPATNKTINSLSILKNPTVKSQNLPTQAIIKFAMPNNSMATTAICSSAPSVTTQSKISVVSPTILMPQQMSTNSLTESTISPSQLRLGGNLHALLAASGSRTTVTNANGMKFLLVNAGENKRGPPITTSTVSSTLTSNLNTPTNQKSINILQQPTNQQHNPQQQQQQQQPQPQQKIQKPQISLLKPKDVPKRTEIRQEYREQLKKRDLLGIKTTLAKILKVQEDANEIQNERLAIERERLQFERNIADRFLSLFEQNQKIQQQLQQQLQLQQQQQLQQQNQQKQHQQQQHFQIQHRPATSSQVFTTTNTAQNLNSNGQMMLPPKLLITTMVPSSAAQAAAAGGAVTVSSSNLTSKVLTTAGFTNLTNKPNKDIQLLVPKEEPQN